MYLLEDKNRKLYMLFSGILYDFAYLIDLGLCSLLIESHQCITNYTKTSHRITCYITFN